MPLDSTDYEVGDLVILIHHIDWINFYVSAGEMAFIVEVYEKDCYPAPIYDCRLKTLHGGEIDVWFGEVRRLEFTQHE